MDNHIFQFASDVSESACTFFSRGREDGGRRAGVGLKIQDALAHTRRLRRAWACGETCLGSLAEGLCLSFFFSFFFISFLICSLLLTCVSGPRWQQGHCACGPDSWRFEVLLQSLSIYPLKGIMVETFFSPGSLFPLQTYRRLCWVEFL